MVAKEILNNTGFILYCFGQFLSSFSVLVPLTYVPSLILGFGKNSMEASLAITIMGIGNLLGRLSCGVLDKFPAITMKVNSLACLGSAIFLAVMPHCKILYLMYTVCFGFGITSGIIMSITPLGDCAIDWCSQSWPRHWNHHVYRRIGDFSRYIIIPFS